MKDEMAGERMSWREFWIDEFLGEYSKHKPVIEPDSELFHVIEIGAFRELEARCKTELSRNIRLSERIEELEKKLRVAEKALVGRMKIIAEADNEDPHHSVDIAALEETNDQEIYRALNKIRGE